MSIDRVGRAAGFVLVGTVVGLLIGHTDSIAHGVLSLTAADYIEIARTALEAIGGLWVLNLYLKRRQGQGSLDIGHSFRTFQLGNSPEESVLIVRLTIKNTREVLVRELSGRVTLLDASQRHPETGEMVLAAFGERDPFVQFIDPTDPEFEPVALEPGDQVDSEMAFRIERTGLMAVRVAIEGKQGELDKAVYQWNSFFYVDPAPAPRRRWWR